MREAAAFSYVILLTWEARALLPDAKRQSGDGIGELQYAFANDPKWGIKSKLAPNPAIAYTTRN